MKLRNYTFDFYPDFPNDFVLEDRVDPDGQSRVLYDDLLKIFFNEGAKKKLGIKSVKRKGCSLLINEGEHIITSDYIGASVNWGIRAGFTDEDGINLISVSRTIGGHVMFPKGGRKQTVNQARGGSAGYYDRFDLTLLAIKAWFKGEENIKIKRAIDNYNEWFNLFKDANNSEKSFRNFIEFFKLEEFVSEKYDIIDLIKSDIEVGKIVYLDKEDIYIPKTREDYLHYVKNSNAIILKRSKKLAKLLE